MRVAKMLGAACAMAIAAGGCGSDDQPADLRSGATYTEPLVSDPGNLHPLRAQQQMTFRVLPFVYDSLINLDAKGRVVSQLAEKWNATAKRATFTLRDGITCADGTKLTASAVADNFEWVKDPKNKATVIGESLPSADFEVQADDAARTVTISFAQPYGFLLEGAGLMPIVCPKGLADPKRLAHGTDGTGPFELADYVADDHLTLTARKEYRWGPDGASTGVEGFPSKVELKIVQDESTTANLLLSGQLNSAPLSGPERIRLEGQGVDGAAELSGPYDLFFNQRRDHPGADPDVRKALATALDLGELMKVITQGQGERPTGLALLAPRPCRSDSVAGAVPEHDPAAAAALLDGAGWTAGSGGIRAKDGRPLAVTVLYPTGGGAGLSAGMELVAKWWKELGVDVKIKGQGSNAALQTLFAGNAWDVAVLSVDIPFPNMFMPFASGPVSPDGQNFAAIENAEYEKLAAQALQTAGGVGCDLWLRAEQALFREVDVVPAAAETLMTFKKAARLRVGINGTEPTSIRMLAD